MTEQEGTVDPNAISPEQFVSMVQGASDEDIASAIHGVGTEATLEQIFQGMQDRFRPDQAQGVDAKIQFNVTDEGQEYPYGVTIANGTCTVEKTTLDSPKVALTTDLVTFIKLITGQAQGPALFMSGKLKVSGDIMFSARIMNFFEQPKAS